MAIVWYSDDNIKLFAESVLKKPQDFVFLASSACSSTLDITSGADVSTWGWKVYKNGLIQQFGHNLSSPNVSEQHLHGEAYVKFVHNDCPTDTPAVNQSGTQRESCISADFNLVDDTWTDDKDWGQATAISDTYHPDYNEDFETEIAQIWQDIKDGAEPSPLWPGSAGNPRMTPIYLNRLSQRKTPFYEPIGSTRAGRLRSGLP